MPAGDPNDTVTSELDHRVAHAPRAEILVVTIAHAPANQPLYPQVDDVVRVGRRPVCNLALADEELSGDHFGIVYRGNNLWRITDYGSKNGTYVNGLRVHAGSVEHLAAPHIVVRAGGTILLLGSFTGLLRNIEVSDYVVGTTLAAAHHAIANYAREGIPLLIEGETGSGKEQAGAIAHKFGRNKRGPFIAENASNITEPLAESQLFGVTKGAATGVTEQPGLFARADRGTLFLDEIHTLSTAVQAKLLRVLQEGTYRTVGGIERKVDVQLVCATNVDLRARVAEGKFASDFFMRIAGAVVQLPPLRARPDEIPYLIAKFAADAPVHADYVEACLLRPWPGNVRELQMATRAAVVSARAPGASESARGTLRALRVSGVQWRRRRRRARTHSRHRESRPTRDGRRSRRNSSSTGIRRAQRRKRASRCRRRIGG